MKPHNHDDDERLDVTRRSLLAATATGVAASTIPTAAAVTVESQAVQDTLTLAALEAGSNPALRDDALGTIQDSDGLPTWIVAYSEGDLASVEEWASGDGRAILDAYTHEPSRTTVVRASPGDIGATQLAQVFGSGLASREYVKTIDANPRLSLAKPIDRLPGKTDVWPADAGGGWFASDLPAADGLAFDDVETSTMAEVRSATNANDLADDPTIAVVDTGINTANGSLFEDTLGLQDGADNTRVLTSSKNMITGETVADVGIGAIEDGNGHGTFVAAEVAGDPPDTDHKGILPAAKLIGVRALNDDGSGSTSDIARGIRYAADQGADVIVLSLGSPAWSHELVRALEYASGAGAIAVAATGNDRLGTRWVAAPSSSSRAIAVASTTAGGSDGTVRSSYFSNVGPHPGTTDLSGGESNGATVDVAAPGHAIETTVADTGGNLTTAKKSGTSMAAPVVAAIVGALGSSDVDAARTTLQDTATRLEAAAEAEVGAGLVDADAALSGDESAETQAEVMGEDATARDDAYRAESESRGRTIVGWF